MKKTLLLAFFCLGTALWSAESYKTLFNSARKAEGAKQTVKAIELYKQAAAASAKPAEQYQAVQKAARLLTRAKKKRDARKLLLDFAENKEKPALNRVLAYLESLRTVEDAGEKLKLMDSAIAIGAGNWPEAACYNEKAAIFAAQKKYPEAVAVYKKVAEDERYPFISRTVSYMGMASVAVARKDYKEAHRCYQCIYDFSRKNPKFSALDALKAEAALFNREGRYDEAQKINLAIAGNPKISRREREKACNELIETEYNRRNDPIAAKKMLKETENLKLKRSFRVEKAARDIKYLFDEE